MNIEILKSLRDNPIKKGVTINLKIEPKPLTEITQLEQIYNSGKPFPKALRELLYLAGNYGYVLSYGINDSQQELQEYVREYMADNGRIISRPFYAIDVYNGNDQFLFIYLDEGDNPPVYEGHDFDDLPRSHWIEKLAPDSLSDFINRKIDRVKRGQNPF